MKHVLVRTLVGTSLLLFSLTANAQTTSEQMRSTFYSEDQYQLTHSMFDKITADLSRAQTDTNSPARFDRANTQLRQLEQSWDKGQYISREMEGAISAIQTVLSVNHLMPRDRGALSADLSQLLDFRREYY
ncbi:MAG TPA: hypothetical protein VK776_18840 [Bryobacteraceae bacterium]|jgi:hypothetical protein|nr:hypothetical protein [Bryobacteraceae bacterium]